MLLSVVAVISNSLSLLLKIFPEQQGNSVSSFFAFLQWLSLFWWFSLPL